MNGEIFDRSSPLNGTGHHREYIWPSVVAGLRTAYLARN